MNWWLSLLYAAIGGAASYVLTKHPDLAPFLTPIITVIVGHMPSPIQGNGAKNV